MNEGLLNLNKLQYAVYGFALTQKYALKLAKTSDPLVKKNLRLEFTQTLFSTLNIHVKIENNENIPTEGQYLICSNHRSILDPLAIDMVLEKSDIFALWVAKKELYNNILLGKAVRSGGCIQLDRGERDTKTFLSDIKKGLAEGSSVAIFPEGTRNKTKQRLLSFKKGFAIIARRNRLPILPVYIKSNASEVLHASLLDNSIPHELTVVIGETIEHTNKNDLEELYRGMFGLEESSVF